MDQIKLLSFGIIKFLYEIKWVVVVFVSVAVTTSTAVEASNEPPQATSSPPPRTGPNINPSIIIVLACLLSAFLLICLFFFYFCQCAERQLALASTIVNRDERRSAKLAAACGLDPTVIATFTTFTYSTVKEIKRGPHVLECAVCLIEFTDDDTVRLLPECNHVFHRDCIDEWLALRVTCPVCRASLVPKPKQTSPGIDMSCSPNGHTKGHVSVELTNLTDDIFPGRKLSRFYSTRHLMVERHIEDVGRYTLQLSEEAQNVLKNLAINPSASPDVSNIKESSLKMSLKSVSANFFRGSEYFDYERFGQERQPRERNLMMTRSFNSRGGSEYVEDEAMTGSQRFKMLVKSPLRNLFHKSNKIIDTDEKITDKLSPINKV